MDLTAVGGDELSAAELRRLREARLGANPWSGAAVSSSRVRKVRLGYQEARRRLEHNREVAERQRTALVAAGLTPEEVERAMQPLLSFQAQSEEAHSASTRCS